MKQRWTLFEFESRDRELTGTEAELRIDSNQVVAALRNRFYRSRRRPRQASAMGGAIRLVEIPQPEAKP